MSQNERPGISTAREPTPGPGCPRPRLLPTRPAHGPIYKRKDSTSQSSASSIATAASFAPLPSVRLPGRARTLARGRGLPPSGAGSARSCAKPSCFPGSVGRLRVKNDAETDILGCQLQAGPETSNMPRFRIKFVQPKSCQVSQSQVQYRLNWNLR